MTATLKMPEKPKWERSIGLKTIPITLVDILEAISAAQSVILKEVAFNPIIKGDARIRETYEKHHTVLGKLMDVMAYGAGQMRQGPTKIIPSRSFHK